MADRELRQILSSGEIPDVKIGDTNLNSSVATKQYVIDSVSPVELRADALEADVAVLQTEAASKGLLVNNTDANIPLSLTTSFSKIEFAPDVLVGTETNGFMSYDVANKRFIITAPGVYVSTVFGTIAGDNGREVTFTYYLNGQDAASGQVPVYICNGTSKPIRVSDGSAFVITQAHLDTTINSASGEAWVEIHAKSDSAGTVDILSSKVILEKK